MRKQTRASLGKSIQARRRHPSQLLRRPENTPPGTHCSPMKRRGDRIQNMKCSSKGNLPVVLVKLRAPSHHLAPRSLPQESFFSLSQHRFLHTVAQVHNNRGCHSHPVYVKVSLGLVLCTVYTAVHGGLVPAPPSPTHPSKQSSNVTALQKPLLTPPLNCLYFLLSQVWDIYHFSREFFPDHPPALQPKCIFSCYSLLQHHVLSLRDIYPNL